MGKRREADANSSKKNIKDRAGSPVKKPRFPPEFRRIGRADKVEPYRSPASLKIWSYACFHAPSAAPWFGLFATWQM